MATTQGINECLSQTSTDLHALATDMKSLLLNPNATHEAISLSSSVLSDCALRTITGTSSIADEMVESALDKMASYAIAGMFSAKPELSSLLLMSAKQAKKLSLQKSSLPFRGSRLNYEFWQAKDVYVVSCSILDPCSPHDYDGYVCPMLNRILAPMSLRVFLCEGWIQVVRTCVCSVTESPPPPPPAETPSSTLPLLTSLNLQSAPSGPSMSDPSPPVEAKHSSLVNTIEEVLPVVASLAPMFDRPEESNTETANMSVMDGRLKVLPMAPQHEMMLADQSGANGFASWDGDVVAFASKNPSRLNVVNFGDQASQGEILYATPVSPAIPHGWNLLNPPGAAQTVLYYETNLSARCKVVEFWSGGLRYSVESLQTQFQAYQLYLVYYPTYKVLLADQLPTYEEALTMNGITFNGSSGNHRVSMDIEYNCPYDYCSTSFPGHRIKEGIQPPSHTGYFIVYVMNPLLTTGTVASNIDLNIDVSLKEDFRWEMPLIREPFTLRFQQDPKEDVAVYGAFVNYRQVSPGWAAWPVIAKPRTRNKRPPTLEGLKLQSDKSRIVNPEVASHTAYPIPDAVVGANISVPTASTAETLERDWIVARDISWTHQNPITHSLVEFNPFDEVANNPLFAATGLSAFNVLQRSHFEVRVSLTAFPFMQGSLIAYWEPFSGDTDVVLSTIRNLPHTRLDPSVQNTGCFTVPFAATTRFLSRVSETDTSTPELSRLRYGVVKVVVYNQLKGPQGSPNLSFTVAVRLVTPTIAVPGKYVAPQFATLGSLTKQSGPMVSADPSVPDIDESDVEPMAVLSRAGEPNFKVNTQVNNFYSVNKRPIHIEHVTVTREASLGTSPMLPPSWTADLNLPAEYLVGNNCLFVSGAINVRLVSTNTVLNPSVLKVSFVPAGARQGTSMGNTILWSMRDEPMITLSCRFYSPVAMFLTARDYPTFGTLVFTQTDLGDVAPPVEAPATEIDMYLSFAEDTKYYCPLAAPQVFYATQEAGLYDLIPSVVSPVPPTRSTFQTKPPLKLQSKQSLHVPPVPPSPPSKPQAKTGNEPQSTKPNHLYCNKCRCFEQVPALFLQTDPAPTPPPAPDDDEDDPNGDGGILQHAWQKVCESVISLFTGAGQCLMKIFTSLKSKMDDTVESILQALFDRLSYSAKLQATAHIAHFREYVVFVFKMVVSFILIASNVRLYMSSSDYSAFLLSCNVLSVVEALFPGVCIDAVTSFLANLKGKLHKQSKGSEPSEENQSFFTSFGATVITLFASAMKVPLGHVPDLKRLVVFNLTRLITTDIYHNFKNVLLEVYNALFIGVPKSSKEALNPYRVRMGDAIAKWKILEMSGELQIDRLQLSDDNTSFVINTRNLCINVQNLIATHTDVHRWTPFIDTVVRFWNDFRKSSGASRLKAEPVGVWFQGGSGIGKSLLTASIFPRCVMAILGVISCNEDAAGQLYSANLDPNSKFYDGYHGQFFTILDDAIATRTYDDIIRLLHLVNCNPTPLTMAALEDKGIYFNSKVVMVTTNAQRLNNIPDVTCYEAITRRFPVSYAMSLNPEYENLGRLDMEKFLQESEACTGWNDTIDLYSNVWSFCPINIENGMVTQTPKTFRDVMDQVVGEVRRRNKNLNTNTLLLSRFFPPEGDKLIPDKPTKLPEKPPLTTQMAPTQNPPGAEAFPEQTPQEEDAELLYHDSEDTDILLAAADDDMPAPIPMSHDPRPPNLDALDNIIAKVTAWSRGKGPDPEFSRNQLRKVDILEACERVSKFGKIEWFDRAFSIVRSINSMKDRSVEDRNALATYFTALHRHYWWDGEEPIVTAGFGRALCYGRIGQPKFIFGVPLYVEDAEELEIATQLQKCARLMEGQYFAGMRSCLAQSKYKPFLLLALAITKFIVVFVVVRKLVLMILEVTLPMSLQSYSGKSPRTRGTKATGFVRQSGDPECYQNWRRNFITANGGAVNGMAVDSRHVLLPTHFLNSVKSKHVQVELTYGPENNRLTVNVDPAASVPVKNLFVETEESQFSDLSLLRVPALYKVRDIRSQFISEENFSIDRLTSQKPSLILDYGDETAMFFFDSVPIGITPADGDPTYRNVCGYGTTPEDKSQVGDCGYPYIVEDRMILGIHLLGNEYVRAFQFVSKEKLTTAIEEAAVLQGPAPHVEDTRPHEDDFTEDRLTRVETLERQSHKVVTSTPSSTKYRKSEMRDFDNFPTDQIPSTTRPKYTLKQIEKYASPAPQAPHFYAEQQALDNVKQVFSAVPDRDKSELSFEEVLNGDGDVLVPIKLDTSAGIWNVISSGKKTFFEKEDGTIQPKPEFFNKQHPYWNKSLSEKLEEDEKKVRSGETPDWIWTAFGKDELLPAEKVEAKGCRVICGPPITQTLLMRKYLGRFIAMYRQLHGWILNHAIGMDKERCWKTIHEGLSMKNAFEWVEMDYSRYDSSISPHDLALFTDLVHHYYDDEPNSPEAKARATLMYDAMHTLITAEGQHFVTHHGNKSGIYCTDVLNSFVNLVRTETAFNVLYQRKHGKLPEPTLFREMAALIVLGDDHLASYVPGVKAFWSLVAFCDLQEDWGYKPTSARTKGKDPVPVPPDAASFLKSLFLKGRHTLILPSMPTSVRNNLINWRKKSIYDGEEMRKQYIACFLRFASYDGPEAYEAACALLPAAMAKDPYLRAHPVPIPSYKSFERELATKQFRCYPNNSRVVTYNQFVSRSITISQIYRDIDIPLWD